MQEDQVTCRICSAPAEPDQPLFHPCKCSGTIRYIHQDCLTTWLAHSKKKTCDICKHPYSFTKVYATDMPPRLPITLLIRQLSHQAVSIVLFVARAILVATIWLAFLPLATIWTWRMYFALGDSTAWWISNRPRPHSTVEVLMSRPMNGSASSNDTTYLAESSSMSPSSLFSHPIVRSVSSDIVSGQIIASLIVLVFVAVFLLREWISQNARPGVFEDIDLPPPAEDFARGAQVVQVQPAPVLAPLAADMGERAAPNRQHVVYHRRRPVELNREGAVRDRPIKRLHANGDTTDRVARERRLSSGGPRNAAGQRDSSESSAGPSGPRPAWLSPPRSIDSTYGGSETDEEGSRRRREFVRRIRKHAPPMTLEPEQAQFTFRPSSSKLPEHDTGLPDSSTNTETEQYGRPDLGESPPRPRYPDVPQDVSSPVSPNDAQSAASDSSASFDWPDPRKPDDVDAAMLPTVFFLNRDPGLAGLGPETARTRDPLSPSPSPPSPSSPICPTPPADSTTPVADASKVASESTTSLRRPPLPSVTLPPSSSTSPSTGISRSHGQTPLASPSLATYRAPEEIEAGPSSLAGYFDGEERKEEETGEEEEEEEEDREAEYEHRIYFTEYDERKQNGTDVVDWMQDVAEQNNVDHEGGGDHIIPPLEPPAENRLVVEEGDAVEPGVDRAAEGRPPDPNEEVDIGLEDDMDGVLEAVGLRGPLHAVFQNAALMIIILNTTIGLGIWLPFTLGKCAALLSLDPQRLLQIIQLPLRIIRFITDPIVDTVLLLMSRLFLPLLIRLVHIILGHTSAVAGVVIGHDRLSYLLGLGWDVFERSNKLVASSSDQLTSLLSSKSRGSAPPARSSVFDSLFQQDHVLMQFIEPRFAPLGGEVRSLVVDARVAWLRLALENGTNEKVFAIVLGYSVIGVMLAIYLNVLTMGNVRNAGKALRSAVRQQLLVIKVAAFIVIELAVFPLGCGLMLDACAIWLLPQSSFRSRMAYVFYAPITSIFYHWVMGTMFMYQFAVLLAGCRKIMRPGAMWFIKDPQDQNFHPIRDILERPTLVQLRKLLLSAVMYGFVVAAGVGTVSGVLQLFSRTILPFRWKNRQPLSPVPIDLLFLHLVLPYTLQYFRPRKALRQFGTHLWKYLAAQLRLTSYMFGGRYPSEEYTPKHWSWRTLYMTSQVQMDDAEAVHDGSFRRVPNSDNVALVKDRPAIAVVDEWGNPVDPQQALLIATQNAEAEKAKRNIKEDYAIVYVPPRFKHRVITFITFVWVVGSILIGLALGVPIMLGRGVLRLCVSQDVHDGYSFIAGFYLLWGCWFVGHTIDRMDKRRQRRGGNEPRAEWPLYLAKRSFVWIAQISYMAFFLGVVIPTLIALVVEFYIVHPLRQIADPPRDIHIRIVDMWALGLLYSKIIIRCLRMQPDNDFVRGIDQIKRQGWTHPDPFKATREVIAPVTFGLLGMLFLPAAIVYCLRRAFMLPVPDEFLFIHVYPSLFTMAGFCHAALTLARVFTQWSQSIRDKEFLVEMRLQNHEVEHEVVTEKEIVKETEMESRDDDDDE